MENAIWLFSLSLLFLSTSASVQVKVTNNPADQLIEVVNSNRTAQHLSTLYDNPGLACIALQYIKAYEGDCSAVGGKDAKKPADSLFAETFAPSCGIKISSLSPITGRLLGCQTKYVKPSEAFSDILTENEKSIEIISNKNHTQMGAAVSGSDGGSPYFWCILFSNGTQNISFVAEEGSVKITRPGCFSGANDECNGSVQSKTLQLWTFTVSCLVVIGFALGL